MIHERLLYQCNEFNVAYHLVRKDKECVKMCVCVCEFVCVCIYILLMELE